MTTFTWQCDTVFSSLNDVSISGKNTAIVLKTAKPLSETTPEEIKAAVKEEYSQVATAPEADFNFPVAREFAESAGYPKELLNELPGSMWESFTGAGNPQPFVDARPGRRRR